MDPTSNQLDSSPEPHQPGQVFGPANTDTAPARAAEIPPQPPADAPMTTDSASAVTEESDGSPGIVLPQQTQTVINGKVIDSSPVLSANSAAIAAESRKSFLGGLKRKAVLAPILAIFVLLGGGAAAYFGYYVPNKPDNIWKTALSRTGKGYDRLTDYTTAQFKSQVMGVKLNGNFKLTGGLAADGNFSGSVDKNNGEFTGSLSAGGVKVNADVRLIQSSSTTPDVYFKLDGLQGLGDLIGGFAPQYTSDLNGLNGNWYFVDHSLFDEIGGASGNNLQFNSNDLHSILKAVGDASKQNIFTADPGSAAFTVKRNVGKEKQDGRNVYHFVVGINKDNLKKYVDNLCNNLKNSSLKKFFNNDAQNTADSIGCNTASTSVGSFNTDRTADVWVDTHTKLIHKIRITDPNSKDNYFDIGQDYQGGSSYPFTLGFHDKTSTSTLRFTLDTQVNSLTIKGNTQDNSQGGTSGSLQLTIQSSSAKVTVQKPDNAKNIIQLLNDLGITQTFNDVQNQAKDTERKTDIKALQGHLEAYWADNGFYPTLANLNDSTWRATNMKGLDPAAFKDPDGTTDKLTVTAAAHVYAYSASPAGCDNVKTQCTDYTLTATLDDGSAFTVQSDNSPSGSILQ